MKLLGVCFADALQLLQPVALTLMGLGFEENVLQVEAPNKKVKKSNVPVSEVVYGAMLPADVQQAVKKEFEMRFRIVLWKKPRTKRMRWKPMSMT
ncbi:hypothetical protein CTI12_AA092510 [Artemisia annua]|uniref:Uncharacterized protein n=1 Tax=Artemisia annua TaxID=35608 RepID=A0A2U1PZG5_ARTAN|nr:hypothetical protein CTI12_AA092510 [Artemisia annua]